MKRSNDELYLEELSKRLQGLLMHINTEKPGSAFTQAEIRALSDFPVPLPTHVLPCVRSLHAEAKLIAHATAGKPKSVIFFIQMLQSSIRRILFLLKESDVKKLELVEQELNANKVDDIERKELDGKADTAFETMLLGFLRAGDVRNDNIYENVSMLPELYLPLLDYYFEHAKEIAGKRQWHDFLAISNYMLYGRKLELLELQRLIKR